MRTGGDRTRDRHPSFLSESQTDPFPDADRRWMEEAIREATAAGARGEVPIGAVVVLGDQQLAGAGNASVAEHDPTGHAEVRVLRAAARAAGNYRLSEATLYVTIEPCVMCMGAALQARVARLVFGCADPKGGAAGSLFDLAGDRRLNHRIAVRAGVAEEECRALLQEFFRSRRTPTA
jgi:tRNA(adenine34) deaminase